MKQIPPFIRNKKPQKKKDKSTNVYSASLQAHCQEYILFWDFHKEAINSWRLTNKYISQYFKIWMC